MDRSGKHYVFRLLSGGRFHFHQGYVEHDAIIGGNPGCALRTSLGREIWAYRPRMHDYLMTMPRKSAIIYPKDIAFLLMWADIFPGARVFECGVGSGALSIALLRAIGPTGSLVTYDLRQDMIEQASANVRAYLGETPNWRVCQRDVYEGITHGPFDRVVLDVPDPGQAAGPVADALLPGGIVCSYVPNVTQVQATVEALRGSGRFSEVETYEVANRRWEFDGPTARPVRTMISHTGWLTIARSGTPRPTNGRADKVDEL